MKSITRVLGSYLAQSFSNLKTDKNPQEEKKQAVEDSLTDYHQQLALRQLRQIIKLRGIEEANNLAMSFKVIKQALIKEPERRIELDSGLFVCLDKIGQIKIIRL